MIRFNVPYISGLEKPYIQQVIEGKSIAGGGKFDRACREFFEKKFGFQRCFLTPSCTAAIEMAALILDLEQHDEIIVPSFTFASCPNPFLIAGAKIVLADCDERYPNVTMNQIKPLVNENTKAVMIMHYGGCGIEVQEVADYCKENGLFLIEDAAQCINAHYNDRPLGSFGDLSVFSFHETKNINCGEGGMLVVNNSELFERAELIRQYGTNRTAFQQGKTNHYEWKTTGLALFLSELNAAFLLGQLEKLDDVTELRIKRWNQYYVELSNFSSRETFDLPNRSLLNESNAHTFYIRIQHNRLNQFIDFMTENDIQVVKHFYPLHLTNIPNAVESYGYTNSQKLNIELVRLPLHADITEDNVRDICDKIRLFFGHN